MSSFSTLPSGSPVRKLSNAKPQGGLHLRSNHRCPPSKPTALGWLLCLRIVDNARQLAARQSALLHRGTVQPHEASNNRPVISNHPSSSAIGRKLRCSLSGRNAHQDGLHGRQAHGTWGSPPPQESPRMPYKHQDAKDALHTFGAKLVDLVKIRPGFQRVKRAVPVCELLHEPTDAYQPSQLQLILQFERIPCCSLCGRPHSLLGPDGDGVRRVSREPRQQQTPGRIPHRTLGLTWKLPGVLPEQPEPAVGAAELHKLPQRPARELPRPGRRGRLRSGALECPRVLPCEPPDLGLQHLQQRPDLRQPQTVGPQERHFTCKQGSELRRAGHRKETAANENDEALAWWHQRQRGDARVALTLQHQECRAREAADIQGRTGPPKCRTC
mmetsp:Transcript_127864/g.355828  ORF Transcript_127864/g.355828 Transcript_127864/m.355828 type:complete len:385 (+) Transcript_127864:93-1247(+)